MNQSTILILAAALLVLGILSSRALQGQIASQGPTFTVFFTGDHNAEVASCGCPKADYGGITRRAAFLDTLTASAWEYLQVDAGDIAPFAGLNAQGRLKVETLARAMSTMGYHGITLGDHDLSPGPEFVEELVGWLEQPVLATNYELPDGLSERSRVVEIRGRTIGMLAFLDPDLLPVSTWVSLEPWEEQRERVRALRESCDMLVALAHVPGDAAAGRLIELFPELDLIVAAHEGEVGVQLYRIGKTYVAWAAGLGRHLGRVEVSFREDGSIRRMDSTYLPVIEAWGRRPRMDALLTRYYADMRELVSTDEFLAERMASLEEPEFEYVGNETCVSCHDAEGAQWEATGHAHARETLVREEKDHDPECQRCHTTGFGFRTGFATPASTPDRWNVGCETCHGPGGGHVEDSEAAYGAVSRELCVSCHTESNSPDFDLSVYFPRILHDAVPGGESEPSGH